MFLLTIIYRALTIYSLLNSGLCWPQLSFPFLRRPDLPTTRQPPPRQQYGEETQRRPETDEAVWRSAVAVVARGRIAVCMGALLHTNWVLTAARCVQPPPEEKTCVNKLGLAIAIGTERVQVKTTSELALTGIDLHDCPERRWPILPDSESLYAVEKLLIEKGLVLVRLLKPADRSVPMRTNSDHFHEGSCLAPGFGLGQFADNITDDMNTPEPDHHRVQLIVLSIHNKAKCHKYDDELDMEGSEKVCGTSPGSRRSYKGDIGAPVLCEGLQNGVVDRLEEESLFGMMVSVIVDSSGYWGWLRRIIDDNATASGDMTQENAPAQQPPPVNVSYGPAVDLIAEESVDSSSTTKHQAPDLHQRNWRIERHLPLD